MVQVTLHFDEFGLCQKCPEVLHLKEGISASNLFVWPRVQSQVAAEPGYHSSMTGFGKAWVQGSVGLTGPTVFSP